MLATTLSCALRGLTGVPVSVEADLAPGLPAFTIVGLTDRAIQEARERVRAAVRNAGYEFPARRLTVNLAPAEFPKEGTGYDLAIAVAVLRCTGREMSLQDTALLGELALDARLRPIPGILPMARSLRRAGVRRLVVPVENGPEAALVAGLDVVAAPSLAACIDHLEGRQPLPPPHQRWVPAAESPASDISAVRGQAMAKRALEIAAAGGHNLLMLGPPGTGKTMLAHALASLLPDLTVDESLEVAAIYSLRGALRERSPTATRPPFRAPHHSVSRAGLIGGGSGLAQPGEVSMAHRGVLFLDELCEFPRSLLEALRQPLEDRTVAVVRARGAVVFPADFTFVAAANPCPCGHLGDTLQPCRCSTRQLDLYRSRLSGPLRDRVDLVVHVPRQPYAALFDDEVMEEPSTTVRHRVEQALDRQRARGPGGDLGVRNAALQNPGLRQACALTTAGSRLLATAGERLQLSARAFHRVLRVARTIADLAGDGSVDEAAVAEAIHLRGQVQA